LEHQEQTLVTAAAVVRVRLVVLQRQHQAALAVLVLLGLMETLMLAVVAAVVAELGLADRAVQVVAVMADQTLLPQQMAQLTRAAAVAVVKMVAALTLVATADQVS
jgi:hypothetical protein